MTTKQTHSHRLLVRKVGDRWVVDDPAVERDGTPNVATGAHDAPSVTSCFPSIERPAEVNQTFNGIAVKTVLLFAVLAAAAALNAPIQPPRIYAGVAGGATAAHIENMPSDSPVIRDQSLLSVGMAVRIKTRPGVLMLCTGTPECNGG